MRELTCTLVADGSSDRTLVPVLNWLLSRHQLARPASVTWADLGRLRNPPRTLENRIRVALDLYPADLLFVHRDAEAEPHERRRAEIERALLNSVQSLGIVPAVMVIPVRMMEAWLLFNEPAIRTAAGFPTGRMDLELPRMAECEELANPKRLLHDALRRATGNTGRRLRRFNVDAAVHNVASRIDDFSPLDRLPAFAKLNEDLARTLAEQQWLR